MGNKTAKKIDSRNKHLRPFGKQVAHAASRREGKREADPNKDEFECARCHRILDIEVSVRVDGKGGDLICTICDDDDVEEPHIMDVDECGRW